MWSEAEGFNHLFKKENIKLYTYIPISQELKVRG